ncbi:MAG: hypothetical protein K0R62_1796, partial [Nonomuraea muscovyensis]|nr:hypothetical protein [Nonomuraea muscovyensis]
MCGWWQAIQWSGAGTRIRGSSSARKVAALPGGHAGLATAQTPFWPPPRTANPNIHRADTSALDRVIALLGRERPLAEITAMEWILQVRIGAGIGRESRPSSAERL